MGNEKLREALELLRLARGGMVSGPVTEKCWRPIKKRIDKFLSDAAALAAEPPATAGRPERATPWTVAVEIVRKALMEVYANQFSMEVIASASYAASEVLRLAEPATEQPDLEKPSLHEMLSGREFYDNAGAEQLSASQEFDARFPINESDMPSAELAFNIWKKPTRGDLMRISFFAGYTAGKREGQHGQ